MVTKEKYNSMSQENKINYLIRTIETIQMHKSEIARLEYTMGRNDDVIAEHQKHIDSRMKTLAEIL